MEIVPQRPFNPGFKTQTLQSQTLCSTYWANGLSLPQWVFALIQSMPEDHLVQQFSPLVPSLPWWRPWASWRSRRVVVRPRQGDPSYWGWNTAYPGPRCIHLTGKKKNKSFGLKKKISSMFFFFSFAIFENEGEVDIDDDEVWWCDVLQK